MLALGVRMLSGREEAEDVLQDVYIEIWRRAGDFDPRRGRVKTWLFLRMRSRCLDRLRSPRIARRAHLTPHEVPERRTEGDAEGALERGNVRVALAELPEKQREVLMLGYFGGLSSSEIASTLAVPIGTVKSRTRAGLDRLRTTFGGLP